MKKKRRKKNSGGEEIETEFDLRNFSRMGPVSPPIPPPPLQQQQQQRRWRHAHERVPSFSAFSFSEVIRVPARAAAAGGRGNHHRFSKVLVLPGNPGCSAFYAPFAEALCDELGGGTEVVALSFYGHETLREREKKLRKSPLSLDGQVEHAAAFLEKLLSEVEEEEKGGKSLLSVGVVGHSIGGTVAALAVREVEERRRREGREALSASSSPPPPSSSSPAPPESKDQEARVSAVCAMMPYVAFDEGSSQQRALRLLARSRPARAAACFAARTAGTLLPKAALSALVGFATAASTPPLSRHARETVADFARSGGLGHALFLADTEFRALSMTTTTSLFSSAGAGEAEKGERTTKEKEGSSSPSGFKFSVASSEIWGPLASLGRRASVFAVGRGGGEGGDGESGGSVSRKGQGGGNGNGGGEGGEDHWCPSHHLDLLGSQAPLAKLILDPSQRHDFVACEGEGTARAAKAVAELLRESALAAAAEAEEGGGKS